MNSELSTQQRGYRWLVGVVAAIILVTDQWSKYKIIEWLDIGETWRPWAGTSILELFAFTHITNTGAAFGIFPFASWFFVIVAVVVSTAIIFYTPRLPSHQWWLFFSLGLELGGAIGNLIDRLRLGAVTDFVHIGNFAIFNVADSAVVCGVIILFIHFWLEEREEKASAKRKITTWTMLEPDEWKEIQDANQGLLAQEEGSGEYDGDAVLGLPPNNDAGQDSFIQKTDNQVKQDKKTNRSGTSSTQSSYSQASSSTPNTLDFWDDQESHDSSYHLGNS